MTDLVSGWVGVRSPATSANLGPGFDAFGIALDLYDEVEAIAVDGGLQIDVTGEGAESVPRDESHLVVRAMRATFERLGASQPGLQLSCRNAIPHGRGLGSSSSAVVSGIRLATALLDGACLTDDEALALATEFEGHPDNVAACLFGGFTIAWRSAEGPSAARLDVHTDITATVFVPAESLSTEVARGLLPGQVSHDDASVNAGRAALLVVALTRRPDLLLDATEDRLHQEYRGSAMPESEALIQRLRRDGIPAVVSGAGPSVLAFGTPERPVMIDLWTPDGWRGERHAIDRDGAVGMSGLRGTFE
jgi:homoserine kinase